MLKNKDKEQSFGKNKKYFKVFIINGGTYDFNIRVLITKDTERALKFVNKRIKDNTFAKEHFDCRGCVFNSDKHYNILWLPKIPRTPNEIATLAHEIFHITCRVMQWADISLNRGSEEAFCFLISHLTKQVYRETNKLNKEK